MVYVVSIEGVIGCGKSTIIDKLTRTMFRSFTEPIGDWSLLRSFYENPKVYAAPLQMQILTSYHNMFEKVLSQHRFVIIERSPWSSRYVFSEMHARCGNISEEDMVTYNRWYDVLSFKPDYIIYLNTTTANAVQRYGSRGRVSESSMSPTYIQELNDMYNEAMGSSVGKNTELSIVDANRSAADVYSDVKNIIETIY